MAGKHEGVTMCPFCGKEGVREWHKPAYRKVSHLSDKSSRAPTIDKEQRFILGDCPHCGKTKKQIEDYYKGKDKAPNSKEVAKRFKEQGLPTTITYE